MRWTQKKGTVLLLFLWQLFFTAPNAEGQNKNNFINSSRVAGILPVGGDPQLVERFTQSLEKALKTEDNAKIIGPLELKRQLLTTSGIKLALDAAQRENRGAAQAELEMNREAALKHARDAIIILQTAATRHYAPELLADAQIALGLALLLKPADEEAARNAFQRALEVIPNYTPNPDRFPPRAATIFEEAREQLLKEPTETVPPAEEVLGFLADQSQLQEMAWISITAISQSSGRLKVVIFDKTQKRILNHKWRQIELGNLEAEASSVIATVKQAFPPSKLPAVEAPSGHHHRALPVLSRTETKIEKKPWFKTWWFWTITGAVFVGVGIGVTLAIVQDGGNASNNPSGDYEFRFHF